MLGEHRDRSRPRDCAKALAAYGFAALLAVLIATWALRLWEADWGVPFSYATDSGMTEIRNDSILVAVWTKGLIDHGWYLHNPSVGAPDGLDMHDFPLVDGVFLGLLKLISLAAGDFAHTMNVYFLLTFPLTAVTTVFSLRRLGASYAPALAGGLLFSFLPYHFLRGQGHLFLASYFLIPPMVLLMVRIYLDQGPFFARPRIGTPRSDLRSGSPWAALALALMMGSGNIYYAFFSCYLLLVAGVGGLRWRRRPEPLLEAAILIGAICLGVALNLAPRLVHDLRHGANPSALLRLPMEAEGAGLRLASMLLPLKGHRLAPIASLRDAIAQGSPTLRYGEAGLSTLGLAASVGFVTLLLRLPARRRSARPEALDGLALLNVFALLLGLSGGLGALFNLVARPEIRCYSRISIFIACFAISAMALAAERVRSRIVGRGRVATYYVALALAVVGGILDQTVADSVPPYEAIRRTFASDAEFIGRIEAELPPRAMVFQVPYVGFPEGEPLHGMRCYEPLRAYLHSRDLRWTHGAMKGRPGDLWRIGMEALPAEELAPALAYAGFAGITIHRPGLADRGADLEARLGRVLGSAPMVSRDGTLAFFRLTDYAERLRAGTDPGEWKARRDEVLHPVTAAWGRGFYAAEPSPGGPRHWSRGDARLVPNNPGDRPRRVALAMRCALGIPGPAELRMKGPAWRSRRMIGEVGQDVTCELILPPGRSEVEFSCDAPPLDVYDPRILVFRVEGFTLKELK